MLPDVGIDGEVCIQRVLKADACWPGLLECHGISLLIPILFLLVSFSMQLLDKGHHPYISTGFLLPFCK